MEVDDFFYRLNNELVVHGYQYERGDEGYVYLAFPKFDYFYLSRDDRAYFDYYLCFFVAFDLLVYCYDRENYASQKKKLNIPKFEFGLTNTFVYPEKLFLNCGISYRPEIFSMAFNKYIDYLLKYVPETKPFNILRFALTDKDFEKGTFSTEFRNQIKRIV